MAGCSIDRARVFFQRDEDLVIALYARLAGQLEACVAELPNGDVAERFRNIINTTIVALGLKRGINFAFWLTTVGALSCVATLGVMFHQRSVHTIWLLAML